MDVAITIPKTTSWETWLEEARSASSGCGRTRETAKGGEPFGNAQGKLRYHIGRKPKKLRAGERCFVLHDGFLRGFHYVKKISYSCGLKCEVAGKSWPEGYYLVRSGRFFQLEDPIAMKGFRGFRYVEVPRDVRATPLD